MSMATALPMIINTGLKMYSNMQEGNNAAYAAKAQAQAQARASLANAAQIRNEATRREEQLRRQGRAAVGKKTAAMAQAGVLDTGTSVGVLDQNRVDAESLWNPRFVGCNARLGKKRTAAGAQCSGCRSRVGAALSQLRARYRSDDT